MEKRYEEFTEVWGDTVDLKEMFISILIGATVSITVYILAKFFLTQLGVDKKLLGGYAMLIGILGCVLSGTICSFLFKPKRNVITEVENGQEFFESAYKDLMLSTDKYQSINELPQETQEALDQLGLKSLILNVETSVANNKVSH